MKHIFQHVKNYKKQIALILVLSVLQMGASLYTPTILSTLVSEGILKNNQGAIYTQGFYMLIASSIDLILSLAIGLVIARFAVGLAKDLRLAMFDKIQNFSTQDFQNFGTASYIKRTTTDIQSISNTIGFSMRLSLTGPLMFIGAIVLSMRINFELSLVMLFSAPILMLIIFVLVRSISKGFTSLRLVADRMTRIIHEGLTGVRVIRAFNKDQFELDRYDIENKSYREIAFNLNIKFSCIMPIMMIMINCSNVAVVWLGAGLIEKSQLNVGELMAVLQYAALVLVALMLLSMVFIMIPQGIVSAQRVAAVLDQDNIQSFSTTDQGLGRITEVRFDHVGFRYEGAEKEMLHDINFTATTGQKVAIIGSTGAGKSTLMNLLLRFMDASSGQVLYNGENINRFSESELRHQIALVPQQRNLFAGTIRDNLRFGKPDATDEEMIQALKLAQAWEFVSQLDGLLDARVEQHGENFSGGQKQRLAIARAVIKDASVHIFDDSFSALDAKTEALLRKNLKPATRDAIVFVVSQKISSVVDADQILVLHEGQLVGVGTHEELAKNNTIYREIIRSQSNLEEMEEA